MNDNSYYITASFIPCNTNSYYSVITITTYQTCPTLGNLCSMGDHVGRPRAHKGKPKGMEPINYVHGNNN